MRLVVLGLLLTACASSLQDVREEKPMHRGDFPRPYQALTRCVYERLDTQTGRSMWDPLSGFLYRLDDQPEQRR
jgi:hypothetical protein